MTEYPRPIAPAGHVEPVPRRIRAMLGDRVVLDTVRARYLWEWPPYPQYVIPEEDIAVGSEELPRTETPVEGCVRIQWSDADRWFEEDEEVFVHPRNPYARVDAVRSSRAVRVELEGLVLADSPAPVMVFETGLPPRHYLERTAVNFEHLRASDKVTACPYKGRTSGYWSIEAPSGLKPDLAWTYDYPTREMLAIAGMVAFFDERVDTYVDGVKQERPKTPFFED
jgi:uncharacterized protein (DUF427 family)